MQHETRFALFPDCGGYSLAGDDHLMGGAGMVARGRGRPRAAFQGKRITVYIDQAQYVRLLPLIKEKKLSGLIRKFIDRLLEKIA